MGATEGTREEADMSRAYESEDKPKSEATCSGLKLANELAGKKAVNVSVIWLIAYCSCEVRQSEGKAFEGSQMSQTGCPSDREFTCFFNGRLSIIRRGHQEAAVGRV